MKIKILGVFVLGGMSAAAIGAIAQQSSPGRDLADFRIELSIDRTANRIRLKCTEGCAWETLSFSCDPSGADCESSIDQFGTPAE